MDTAVGPGGPVGSQLAASYLAWTHWPLAARVRRPCSDRWVVSLIDVFNVVEIPKPWEPAKAVIAFEAFRSRTAAWPIYSAPWAAPYSSAPAPPQGAPGGSGQLGTPRVRPAHWAPSHRLSGAGGSRLQSRRPPPPAFEHAGNGFTEDELMIQTRTIGDDVTKPEVVHKT